MKTKTFHPKLLLSLLVSFVAFAGMASAVDVVIDAGHGGSKPGAHHGHAYESRLTLQVAKYLEADLKRRGFSTVMTRTTDRDVGLAARRKFSQTHNARAFVSVHFNGAPNQTAHGVETLYGDSRGKALAGAIQPRLVSASRGSDRGLKPRPRLAVLKKNAAPAALVECGFLSNPEERSRCQDPRYQRAVAVGIATGVAEFLGRPSGNVWADARSVQPTFQPQAQPRFVSQPVYHAPSQPVQQFNQPVYHHPATHQSNWINQQAWNQRMAGQPQPPFNRQASCPPHLLSRDVNGRTKRSRRLPRLFRKGGSR